MTVKQLQALTLDAIKAKSIAQHLQLGETKSHFNPDVTAMQRLATLGEHVGAAFNYGLMVPDAARLQDTLLEIAAMAATWAELIDTAWCSCSDDARIANPCKRHSLVGIG